jgi:uncharacterized protein
MITRQSISLATARFLQLVLKLGAGGFAMSQVFAATGPAADFDLREHYTKYEYRIPMRDGVKLFTSLFVPKDVSTAKYPFLMRRTPYSVAPYGEDEYPSGWNAPPADLAKAGYIFVFQDGRGRLMSGGTFLEYSPRRDLRPTKTNVDESTDTYDTLEWLLAHVPNNNGKVGIWGISYDGFYAEASIADTHPAIKAADIESMGEWNYRHGAFMLADNFEFYIRFRLDNAPDRRDEPPQHFNYWTQDAYDFFLGAEPLSKLNELYFTNPNPLWTDQVRHNTRDDYWRERDFLAHLRHIRCAVLNVGSWFDQYVAQGPVSFYRGIKQSDPAVIDDLVMGPWNHGGSFLLSGRTLGDVDFGSDAALAYRTNTRLPFFEYYLKGKGDKLPAVQAFETGTNVWRKYSEWPPPGTRSQTLYFQEYGGLSFTPPVATSAFDEYVSDPSKPVPFIGYVPAPTGRLVPADYMTADQRFASRRPDVLVYQTEPLEEDLTVAGPVSPKLLVSTSGTDADWVVKLIDVYPSDFPNAKSPQGGADLKDAPPNWQSLGGYQQLVRGEPIRGKFRHGWEHPEPFSPGRVEPVDFTMADINHTFRRGHRVMVQVQSTWFPLIDLNPQSFVNIPDAVPTDFHKAIQRVYHSAEYASGVEFKMLPNPPASAKPLAH